MVSETASQARPSQRIGVQMSHNENLLQENKDFTSHPQAEPKAWRRGYSLFVDVIAAVALIGLIFHVIQNSRHQDLAKISTIGGQLVAQGTQLPNQNPTSTLPASASRQTETNQASVPTQAQEVTQIALASAPQALQPAKEERAEAFAQELKEARHAIQELDVQLRAETAKGAQSLEQERQKTATLAQEVAAARQELTTSTARHRQALEEESARGVALASELAAARREIEVQAALLRKASDETAQIKQAEAANIAQSLEQERQKTAAFAQEAEAARQELTTDKTQHRQALDDERSRSAALASELAMARREIETQVAQLRDASDETRQPKQAAESAILQQERDKSEVIARDREPVRRTIDNRVTSELANSPISRAAQAVELAAMVQPVAAEAQASPEAKRLIARASALLGQGDIGAARTVLERAAQTGSAQASFMLAETYDPTILSAWGTYGTRGEVTKARELYARAHAGGIQEAKNRVDALDQ